MAILEVTLSTFYSRDIHLNLTFLLLPANEVCEGYVFTRVCLSTGEGACMVGCVAGGCAWQECVWQGGHVCWRPCVAGSMHGRGVCVAGGHAWQGGLHGRGVCVAGGHVWHGGMHGRGMCVPCQIPWDMVNERAVRILLECILVAIQLATT